MELKQLEQMTFRDETIYVDLDDVLDIFEGSKKKTYTVVFETGEIWYYVSMKKSVYNKFIKLKKKRGQTDNDTK